MRERCAERSRRRFRVELRCRAGAFNAGLGIDGAHGGAHGAYVVGGGAAAAAHKLGSGGDGLAGKAGHVLRGAEIDIAAFDGAGHAGVGHGRQGQRGGLAHGFNGGKHGGWAGGAVDADGARTPLREARGRMLGRGAIEAVAFVVDRDHDQDGQVGSDFTGGGEGFAGFVERGHGFNDEQVRAGLSQGIDLFGKGGTGFVEAGFAEGLKAHAKRADGAGDPGFSCLLFPEVLDGLAGKTDAGGVDFRDLASQSMAGQAEAVGAKGVGFDNLRTGLQIFLVDGENQAGVGQVQLVVTAVDEDATGVEHGSHGAVGENRAAGKDVGELGHSDAMLSQAAGLRQSRGPLCYTSGVIGWLETGSGMHVFQWQRVLRFAGMAGNRHQSCSRSGLIRVLRRGKGF